MDADQVGTGHDEPPAVVAALAAAGFADAREVGRGGFGVVYRCWQRGLDRVVAVKVMTQTSPDDRARFVREQQAMGRLTGHPNIVAVLQVGEIEGGLPFLVMPYCELGCVQQRITQSGELPVEDVLQVGIKVAGALASAHRVQIVHREVKPANILLTDYGEPALCDFGIARMNGGFKTATGFLVGSPAFTAPEVIMGEPPSAATDVYGLGASLFTALTGHAAFERHAGEQVVAQFVRITRGDVPDLRQRGMPEDLAAVINAAMARDPAQRPSPLELGQQLQQVQARLGLPVDTMALHNAGSAGGSARPAGRPARPASSPAGAAPSTAERPAPGNVPAPLGELVGRGTEMAQLRELLSCSRLVTLSGIGGIGKTTLATHAARELRRDFPEGVWLVELADLREAALLVDVVSAALGIRHQPGRSPAEAVVDFLAPRQVLLVLDNCEQLIDDVAKLVDALLRDCPRLHILTTSREVLDIGGEAVLALSPLPCPAAGGDQTVRTLAGYEAVALFVERARVVLPGFALTQANAAAVARICTRLEGLPLALELAAARVRAMSVEQIAEGLADRFALLARGRRGAPTRQRTLAGCIDWSYQLCTSTEQQLWAQISVFAGSFDLPAVQFLCAEQLGSGQCLDLLCALVDKSILIRTETSDHTARFRLLDTLRDYGRAQLSPTESDHMHRRHADWYEQLLTHAAAEWYGPQQVPWLHRLSTEMPNIREALQTRVNDNPVAALHMMTYLRPLWLLRGMFSEARRWLKLALDATTPAPTALHIRALHDVALIADAQGDLSAAAAAIAHARTLLDNIEDPEQHGLIDFVEGMQAMFSNDLTRALSCFQHALDNSTDYEASTASMYLMGTVLEFMGNHTAAMNLYHKALDHAETRGDPYLGACVLYCLGVALWRQRQPRRAEQFLIQAVERFLILNESWVSPQSLEVLAWIAATHHEPRRAAILMAAANTLAQAARASLWLGDDYPHDTPMAEMARYHKQCERTAREELGEDGFDAAWAYGAGLSFEEAAAFAHPEPVVQLRTVIENLHTA